MSKGTCSQVARYSAMGLMVLVALSLVVMCAVACSDVEEATPTSAAVAEDVATSEATAETTEGTEATEVTEATTATTEAAVTETTAAGPAPSIFLDKDNFGAEIKMTVGERARVDLKPWIGDEVEDVRYEFTSICAKQVDAGTEVIEGIVTEAWMEFEAIVEGPCSIRAFYELPDGTSAAKWVVYVRVLE